MIDVRLDIICRGKKPVPSFDVLNPRSLRLPGELIMNSRIYRLHPLSRALIVCFAMLSSSSVCSSAQPAPAKAVKTEDNLSLCLRGAPTCDLSSLKADEIARIAENRRRRNIEDCRASFARCDPSALPPEEARQLQTAIRQHNPDKCLGGSPGCDPAQLRGIDATRVAGERAKRNLSRCLEGSAQCDPTVLTPSETGTAMKAWKTRNMDACMGRVAEMRSSEPDQGTSPGRGGSRDLTKFRSMSG
jgi:hypothetical protein